MKFRNKTAIVTGGAQGIGMAVSLAFAREGANVVIADMDEEAGLELADQIREQQGSVLFISADIAREDDVAEIADKTVKEFGSIDIVINNAGIGTEGNLFTRPMAEWDRVIAVNLRGPYMMAKYCGQYLMKSQQGVIINIASTRALMSEPDTEPYSASKGGILALTHSLAVSLGPKVRVNAISPGWIDVSQWKKRSERMELVHSPEDLSQHPVGRIGTPEDIANACLFLASPESGFITGANLVIDGGMTVKMIYHS